MNMIRQKRDWFRILRDLMAVDVPMSRIARLCGRDVKTVQSWANGTEPRDSDARMVLQQYARFCPDKYRVHERQFRIKEVD